ncbi:Erythronate-4-phosphate dehydrogenase [Enhygromyxa salina]|uniref:Erythronate-4-phosphate dehydrogenase n=1 Tax=Enhygromyxa salina TaxID=215803 RepID=A0A2S9YCN7_9BACT|nr:DUF3410 domain-containing protein [Enhygromyxa salina]PRQ02880.1 Erythronate-4-phosphate dehydrogenase [Enhygromyxa salina]
MHRPVIVVDDAIAAAREAFAELGTVNCLPSSRIDASTVAALDAEVLLVRSVTRVDADLLERCPSLGFVGTATAGTDHLDLAALAARGIAAASAPGCNARAVAEWVLAALTFTEQARACAPAGPVGLVGLGNVGARLSALLLALGYEVLGCDPPLARSGRPCPAPLVEFDELWRRCSIVSFHVPLVVDGPDATRAYIERRAPALAGPKLLINTSRGPVVRDRTLDRADIGAMILDVWDGEPDLSPARLSDPRLLLASPHVAGYSLEAKIAGTRMIHEALSAHLGRPPSWTGAKLLPPQPLTAPLQGSSTAARASLVARVVDLNRDDARVRALAKLEPPARPRAFEALRREYQLRREFRSWVISPARARDPELERWLQTAGFSLG